MHNYTYITIEGVMMSVEYEYQPADITHDHYDPSYFKILRVHGENGIIWLIRTHFDGVDKFLEYIEEEIIKNEDL